MSSLAPANYMIFLTKKSEYDQTPTHKT